MTISNQLPEQVKFNHFHYAFQISRKIIFNVSYYVCGSNTNAYFTTSADQFNQPKTDFNTCGQAQKELLKEARSARRFYESWDQLHLKDLTHTQYNQIVQDIEALKTKYNFIMHEGNEDISFSEERELSIRSVKKQ